jgi:hypothetical protein
MEEGVNEWWWCCKQVSVIGYALGGFGCGVGKWRSLGGAIVECQSQLDETGGRKCSISWMIEAQAQPRRVIAGSDKDRGLCKKKTC